MVFRIEEVYAGVEILGRYVGQVEHCTTYGVWWSSGVTLSDGPCFSGDFWSNSAYYLTVCPD